MLERVTEGRHTAEHILSETDPLISREEVTFASGSAIVPGQVVGKTTLGAAVAAAKSGGNTGTGTISAVAVLAGAKVGIYTARCIAAAANAGTFRVEDPDGFVVGDVAVGVAFADDVGFTISDGGTDFVVGDGFDITVATGSGKFKPLNPAATDGTQIADAIAYAAVDASAADARGVVSARETAVKGPAVTWPVGITDSQKAVAIAKLAEKHILIR